MDQFLQTLIAATALGSLYALIALGYTLVYGVLKFINFAHSDIFVLGAWTCFTLASVLLAINGGESAVWMPVVVVLGAVAVCAGVGAIVERFAYRPLRSAPRLNVLITAIGVSLLLQNVGQLTGIEVVKSASGSGSAGVTVPFGKSPRAMPEIVQERVLNRTVLVEGTIEPGSRRGNLRLSAPVSFEENRTYRLIIERTTGGGASGEPERRSTSEFSVVSKAGTFEAGQEISVRPPRDFKEQQGASFSLVRDPRLPILLSDVLIVTTAIVLMTGLQFLVFRTKFGTAMRAVSFSTTTAPLMGINVYRVISTTFVIGTGLAAMAAVLYLLKYPNNLKQPADQVWVLLGLKAFVAAVVGGIGNVRGAVLGGFLIAIIEQFGVLYGEKLLLAMNARPGLGTSLGDVYVFGVLILVLLLRPNGLLGSAVREKV